MQNQTEKNNYSKLFWLLAIILLAFLLFNLTNSSASAPSPQNIVQSGGANIFSQLNDTINNFKQILN